MYARVSLCVRVTCTVGEEFESSSRSARAHASLLALRRHARTHTPSTCHAHARARASRFSSSQRDFSKGINIRLSLSCLLTLWLQRQQERGERLPNTLPSPHLFKSSNQRTPPAIERVRQRRSKLQKLHLQKNLHTQTALKDHQPPLRLKDHAANLFLTKTGSKGTWKQTHPLLLQYFCSTNMPMNIAWISNLLHRQAR